MLVCIILFAGSSSFADTFITNTATANFSIGGVAQQLSDSAQFSKQATIQNLSLSKSSFRTSAKKGDLINYSLNLQNTTVANNVVIKDTLPAGLVYISGTAKLNSSSIPSSQVSYSGNQLNISLGNLPANNSLYINYSVRVSSSTPLGFAKNIAIATSDAQNSQQAQAIVRIYKPVSPPPPPVVIPTVAIQLEKLADISSAKIGEVIRYTLKIKNTNNKTISNITIEDTLPAGLIYKTGSATLNTKPITASTSNGLSFSLGAIQANTEWSLSYDAIITNKIASHRLENQAKLMSSDAKANSAIVKNTVEIVNDILTLSKQANKQKINIGDFVSYTVNINNPSSHELNNLIIKDTLPTGFIYQAGTAKIDGQLVAADKIHSNGNLLQITVDSLNQGKSLLLSYQVKVSQNAKSGSAINQVEANSSFATSGTATASINVRTPSIINFLKIDSSGVDAIIPPTSFNSNKNGDNNWQIINRVALANGEVLNLPVSQPVIHAERYSASEPVVIEVIDLDQNIDPNKKETIIVKIKIPGTNDEEELLLTETSADSGTFRGVLLTTTNSTQSFNGELSVIQGAKITVSYHDDEDNTDTSATVALITPNTPLILAKTADKETASIGEQVRYTLQLNNTNNLDLPLVKIEDTLPVGFRYVIGSASINGSTVKLSQIGTVKAQGRSLQFNLSNMPSGSQWKLEYLTKISAGVQIGKAINKASAFSGNLKSNIARATVRVKDDLMRSKNILTGRVYIGCNKNKVLNNTRIYLETGRSVLSDSEGFWHMEAIEPGTHVLQLDVDSLPTNYEPLLCNDNTRHAGDAKSQFVDLQAGALWQVDFYVKAGINSENSNKVKNQEKPKKVNPLTLYGDDYLKTAAVGFEILWPKNNYVPAVASTKIMVKSSPQQKLEVFLNGKKVSPLNYDGSETNKNRTVTIRRWVGVDINIKDRNNTLLVIAKDKSGKEIARQTRNIHFSGEAASAILLPKKSSLVADGKTTPIIALLVRDEDGYPLRANTHGYFTLENSQYQIKTQNNKGLANLNESTSAKHKYMIDEDGIARIKLNPSSQSGEVKLKLHFLNSRKKTSYKTITAWMKPKLRNWILVGLAEGTLAHKTLSGNMQTLEDLDNADNLYKRGRISFFAKGKVKGKYLLTVAYDTRKKNKNPKLELEQNNFNNIDPDAWYTLYADNGSSQFEAASSRKLYLKIEKDNFYAMFGDFNADLSVTTLASYKRTLNGIKSGYKSDKFSYSAFVSETSNKHHHQEIPGDGTSGQYHLDNDIVVNSETIKIETRDRFYSETVLETRNLARYQDYDIDYDAGTLFFKFPISGRDKNFNPNIIVIDYDSESESSKDIIAGGRISTTSDNKKLEVGMSAIHLARKNLKDDSLVAFDASYKITPDTKIHAEIAQSKSINSDNKSAQAEILELEKQIADMEAKIYYRKQDKNFGIANQGVGGNGTKKMGAELRYKFSSKTEINAEVSQQQNLSNDNTKQLISTTVKHRLKQAEISAGLRHSKEELDGKTISNDSILLGGKYTTSNGVVTLRTNIEKNLNSNDDNSEPHSELSPDRITVGVDVKLAQGLVLFAEHENSDNGKITTQNNRIGISRTLWKGAKAKTTYTNERTAQGQRNYATFGLSQQIKITDKINADFNIDHAKTIGATDPSKEKFNQNEPNPQGSQRDDYTAFSVGLGSSDENWSWTTRAEIRKGNIEDKINLRAGLIHKLNNGRQLGAKFSYSDSKRSNDDNETITKLSLSSAWHPKEKDFVFLSRLDLVDENKKYADKENTQTQKIIHNAHYSRKLNKKTQISLHHGIKHIIDKNQQTKNKSTIDTASVEIRRDINDKWDIGAHGGYLHDWSEDTTETLAGVSIGVTPAENMWLSLGYNFKGFDDKDFDDNDHKQKGAYISFRYKFNQDSLGKTKKIGERTSSSQSE